MKHQRLYSAAYQRVILVTKRTKKFLRDTSGIWYLRRLFVPFPGAGNF
jgi:hypothetical protein